MKKLLVCVFCFFLFQLTSFAQRTVLYAQLFNTKNGLSHNTITAIKQDAHGYVWIATPNGLNRYDGYGIKQYFHSITDSASIADNYVNNIFITKRGDLYIFCRFGGICRYDYRKDCFTTTLLSKERDANKIQKNNVHSMIEDSYGNEWIASDYAIARRTKTDWVWYTNIGNTSQPSQGFMLLGLNERKQLLVSPTVTGGIYYYETSNDGFFPINSPQQNGKSVRLVDYLHNPHSDCQYLAATFDGIYVSNSPHKQEYEQYSSTTADQAHRLASNSCCCLFLDKQNTVWAGLRNAGLCYFDAKEKQFISSTIYCGDKQFAQYTVLAMCDDDVNNLWVGTEDNGAFCIGYRSNQFQNFTSLTTLTGELANSNISCITEDADKHIWMGTYSNELLEFSQDHSLLERFTIPNCGMILDICSNNDGRLWIATWGGGVYLFDPTRGSIVTESGLSALHSFHNCKSILKTQQTLWIATHDKGLLLYNYAQKQLTSALDIPAFQKHHNEVKWINDISTDADGHIWMATNNGLLEYDGSILHKWENYENRSRRSDDIVSIVYIDKKQNVWTSNTFGLDLFNRKTHQFAHLHAKHKALATKITSISEDANGVIWLTSESEVICYSPQSGFVRVFDAADGVNLQQFNDKASLCTSGNELLLGGNTGFAMFRPERVTANTVVPQVVINSCFVLDTAYGATQSGLLPTKDILRGSIGDTIQLEYSDSRFFGFEYCGINLIASTKIQYAYRLDGFDSYWHYAGAERKASYTNLPPGTYVFRVKAANSDGFWNEKGTALTITILTPWWRQWWFISLLVLGGLGIVFGYVYYRTEQIRKINRRLEEQVEQRTQQLHEKSLFIEAQNNDLLYKNAKIEDQNDELSAISNQLQKNNVELQYKNEELESMTEELRVQSEALQSTNDTLLQTIATKDKLFSVIAHDLKNPFSGIISFIDLLQNDYEHFDDEKRQYFISMISKSSQTVFGLLTNLFNWARSQTGMIDVKPESFNIDEIIYNVKEQQQHIAESKSISIDIQSDNPVVYADRSMIETVVRNLLHNALKFTRPGGTVTILAQPSNNQIHLQVIDSGVGIAPERINHLFSPNQVMSTHGTDSEKGSGLGLLICKEFTELNHGTLTIQSEVEQGTTCTVLLPLGDSVSVSMGKQIQYKSRFESMLTVREKAAPKTRILVVDDSKEIRLSMVEHLEYYFTVKAASDGEEAWQILQKENFDLMVSDVMMAGVDGFELCKKIRKNKQMENMGVVLVTANTEEKNQIIGLSIGADAYLEKPFSMALLLSQVNATLQRKRNSQSFMPPPSEENGESTIEQETIDKINGILEANFAKTEFGIEQLADIMCMSRSQLYRKMRLWYGITPIEYLQRYRLQKSTELLKTGKYRMIDVASLSGFSCQQYFTTVFTKFFAVSPSEYMRMHRR